MRARTAAKARPTGVGVDRTRFPVERKDFVPLEAPICCINADYMSNFNLGHDPAFGVCRGISQLGGRARR